MLPRGDRVVAVDVLDIARANCGLLVQSITQKTLLRIRLKEAIRVNVTRGSYGGTKVTI
jgi:hypothetical protein